MEIAKPHNVIFPQTIGDTLRKSDNIPMPVYTAFVS